MGKQADDDGETRMKLEALVFFGIWLCAGLAIDALIWFVIGPWSVITLDHRLAPFTHQASADLVPWIPITLLWMGVGLWTWNSISEIMAYKPAYKPKPKEPGASER